METNLKITIDQLKNYFGTGLKFEDYYFGKLFEGEMDYHNFPNFIDNSITSKLKLYSLSDLDKFIPDLGFVPIEELNKIFGYELCRLTKFISPVEIGWAIDGGANTAITWSDMYPVIEQLFKWHFWPFGEEYFEKGLVIDKLKQK
jgi:hypothetical protein